MTTIGAWWDRRSPREQRVLVAAALLAVAALLWQLVLDPLARTTTALRERARSEQAQLDRMRLRAAEIDELAKRRAATGDAPLRERAAAAFQSVPAPAAKPPIVEAASDGSVRVRLESARFDAFVVALDSLLRESGARVAELSATALESPGSTRIELLVTR